MQEIPTATRALTLVVAAALIDREGRVCLQQRPIGGNHGGLWEFPGGKVEPGETPRAALVREIREELGTALEPESLAPAGFAESGSIVILLYVARHWTNEVQCLEGEAIGWVEPERIRERAMPPLDYPLARQLGELLAAGAI